MPVLEREATNKEKVEERISVYLDQAVPRAIAKGVKQQAKGKAFVCVVKLPRWMISRETHQLGLGWRDIPAQIATIAGPTYVVNQNPLLLDYGVEITLPH